MELNENDLNTWVDSQRLAAAAHRKAADYLEGEAKRIREFAARMEANAASEARVRRRYIEFEQAVAATIDIIEHDVEFDQALSMIADRMDVNRKYLEKSVRRKLNGGNKKGLAGEFQASPVPIEIHQISSELL